MHRSEPEPLNTLRDDVPAELAAVVTRMMAKDPDERIQTPERSRRGIEAVFPISRATGNLEPPTQAEPRRWKPTFLSLTAVAVLFVAAIFAGLIYFLQTDYGEERFGSSRENGKLCRSPKAENSLPPRTALAASCSRSRATRLSSWKGSQTGETSEVDTGRIEIDSTTTPKTIDFIGRAEHRLASTSLWTVCCESAWSNKAEPRASG